MGEYYTCLLDKLDDNNSEKIIPKLAKKILFLQDNESVHICFGDGENQGLLKHLAYSPDLTHSLSSDPKPEEICKWKAFRIK